MKVSNEITGCEMDGHSPAHEKKKVITVKSVRNYLSMVEINVEGVTVAVAVRGDELIRAIQNVTNNPL